MEKTDKKKLFTLTGTAMFAALTVVLQITLGVISVGGVNLNFVLIPIVVCGIIFGKIAGTIVGSAFGLTVFFQCISGAQGVFGTTLFGISPLGTFVACVVRGALMGFAAPLVYELVMKLTHKTYVGALAASAVLPVVNTGVFLLFYATIFHQNLVELAAGAGTAVISFLFIGLAGVNFLLEMATTILLAPPVAAALLKAVKKL